MRKRRILLFGAAGLLVLTCIALFRGAPEPSYAGRSLSDWVCDMQLNALTVPERWQPPQTAKASAAVRQIGTNATSFVTSWIRYRQHPWKPWLLGCANRVSQTVGRTNKFWDKKLHKAVWASSAFGHIQTIPNEAIPQLVTLMNDRDSGRAHRALQALENMSRWSVPALMVFMTNASADTRKLAVIDLGFRPDADIAGPRLIEMLRDESSDVAMWAAIRLGGLNISPAAALPALTNSLCHPSPEVRSAAASALRRFESAAIPALIRAQSDSDPLVQTNACLAVSYIKEHLQREELQRRRPSDVSE